MIGQLALALLIGLAIGGGAGFAILRHRVPPPSADTPASDRPMDLSNAYAERFRLFKQWQDALARFQSDLSRAYTVEEMVTSLQHALQREFASFGGLVAIGPLKDFLLLDSMMAMNTKQMEIQQTSCLVTLPVLRDHLATELAQEIYDLTKKMRGMGKRWALLRDIQPNLQQRLASRYQIPGLGIVIPLLCGDILCGAMLIAGDAVGKSADIHQECGRFASMASDIITTWVRCMAPQLLGGTAFDPVANMPTHAINSLHLLEQSASAMQAQIENRDIMAELATYSRSVLTPAAEISLLAIQTCASLRKVSAGDFTMVLRPLTEEPDARYLAEAIETDRWSWSRYQGFQGQEAAIFPFAETTIEQWPDSFVAKAVHDGHLLALRTSEEMRQQAATLNKLGIQSLVAIPAMIRGHSMGVLVIGRKQAGEFSELSLLVATAMASLAATSLGNLFLTRESQRLQEKLEGYWRVTSTTTKQCLDVLSGIVKRRSILMLSDPDGVATYAVAIAKQMQCDPKTLSLIRLAALLADIGAIMIPSALMRKEGGLTGEELRLIQNHPLMSVELLERFDVLQGILPIVRHHHERYDGTGYPEGLHARHIPLEARIIAVADAFVHMQMQRPYRSAMTREEAVRVAQEEAGRQFDAEVVQALVKVVHAEDATGLAA